MNIEELKQYRKELLKNREKQYICVSLNRGNREQGWKIIIKTEGEPLTKEEIMNKTNTEEGIKEFEKTMVDAVNRTKDFNYDFDMIYLHSSRKFYCEVSIVNELLSLYENAEGKTLKKALEYYINSGDIIVSHVPINFDFAEFTTFLLNDEYKRNIDKEYDDEEYDEEDMDNAIRINIEGRDIIVNIEEFDNAIRKLGYEPNAYADNPDGIRSYKDLLIDAWWSDDGEYESRRIYLADLRNLKKTKKK